MNTTFIAEQFDAIAADLAEIDVDALWEAATETERRVLIDEMIEAVDVHEDHLEVTVTRRTQAERRTGGSRARTPG